MATKFIFNDVPAYQEGPFALVKQGEKGLWHVYHIQTKMTCMRNIIPFIQKRDALTYVLELLKTEIDWNLSSFEEFYLINSESLVIDQLQTVLCKWEFREE